MNWYFSEVKLLFICAVKVALHSFPSQPCIIGIYDVIDTEDALYMILELVEGGELFDRIVSLGQLSESDAKFLFLQMVIAVKYLHEHGITHRDLKPENILLTGSDNRCLIKVTDFGLSKLVDGNTMLRTFCGTPTYLAPEILKTAGSGTYTSAIDVWSLGVILYVCLVGYPPFTDERTDCDLQTQITKGLYDYPEKYWSGISAEAKDLVSKMLTVEPNERLTIQAVVEHPWLTDSAIQEEVQKLMASSTSPTAVIPPLRSQASFGQQSDESQPATSSTSCEDKEVGDVANGLPEKEAMNGKPLVRKRLSTTESDIPRKCMTR
ncbi:unnamed protein product [Calicophoron daubneyi]|uniref:Protein kinase domain-containing protein n=1 Tax=Calicophoron daubneyi TaxID=300641 RepID=A0AAV2T2W1_CALDB